MPSVPSPASAGPPRRARELRKLSVVTPMLDEEAVAESFYRRIAAALEGLEWELIVVDDGSTDATPRILDDISAQDPRVLVLHLSRSFGHQPALTAGLDHATGDAAVTIDADLQDPPEVIPALVEEWRKGADVVTAVRRTRAGEPRWRLAAISAFYRLFARVASVSRSPNAGDFRLLDRSALRALAAMPERNRFLRGMANWIGFRQAEVLYDRQAREAGKTKYPFLQMMRLALDGVASFSRLPLQLSAYLGFFFAGLAFLGVPTAIGARLAGIYVPGIASVIMLVCFLGGLQLITLGVIGEYLGRIYDEVKHRPLYIVRERVSGGTAAEDT